MRGDDHESGLGREQQKEETSSQLPPVFLPCEPSPQKQVFGCGPDLGDRSSHPRAHPVCWVYRALKPPLSTDVDNPGVPRLFFLPTRVVR